MSLESFAAAGLYDPDAPNAVERREYLEYLLAQGHAADDIIGLYRPRTPITDLLAILTTPLRPRMSPSEIATRAGTGIAEVMELREVLGLPLRDETQSEIEDTFIEDLALYEFGVALFGRERTLAFCRVMGAAVSGLVDAGRELFWTPVGEAPTTELEVAQANLEALQAWLALPAMVGHLMVERAGYDSWIEEEMRLGTLSMAVAFVDLVDSTEWTRSLTAEDHAAALNRFEDRAVRLAGKHGARVVKFIGDEAMFVGPDPAQVAEVVASLCAFVAADQGLPRARSAIGWGKVTPRGGDYFGEVVNLVARMTAEAPTVGIVMTVAVASRLDRARWLCNPPRSVDLRGIEGVTEVVDAVLPEAMQT